LTHPIILGIDQPIKEVAIMPYNGAKYSDGIGGGSALKLAVKVPYLTLIFDMYYRCRRTQLTVRAS
jgi:hypothetical protein